MILQFIIIPTKNRIKTKTANIIKRTMMISRCAHAARAAYYVATTISNYQFNDNNELFINKVVNNALDSNQGVPQHKTTLWKHLSNKRLPGEYYYESFKNQVPNATQIVKYEPNVSVDFRTTNELAVLKRYIENFGSDVAWIYATLDTRAATFPKANQTNPDFWVHIDNAFGLKPTYQDEKSGMGMLEHATRGSLGVLYFDENGKNIQVTSKPITTQDLIKNNEKKLKSIEAGLKEDGLLSKTERLEFSKNPLAKNLHFAKNIVQDMEGKSYREVQHLHNELQQLLWKNLQSNPSFNRSISFIFLKQIINSPMTEKEAIFSQAFQSKLKDNHLYDLDKKGDFNEIYIAFIHAGKKVDPYFIDKLYYLHKSGISLTTDVLTIMKEITKNAIR